MPDRAPLNPAVREFLDEQALHAPDFATMPDALRKDAHRAALERALALRSSIDGLPNAVGRRDLTVANDLGARLYTPPGPSGENRPLLVYLHGGGWVAGSLDTHDPFCCLLSEAAAVPILSIDYRQPPEHRYPAALDDAVAAVQWAAAHASELGADPKRLALGGDSAGGNLAAAATARLRRASGTPTLAAQLLLYPVTDHPSANHPSYQENGTGFGLTADSMRWFWRQYAPEGDPNDRDLSPLRGEAGADTPPTLITTAEYDVLRDEGLAYVEKLKAAKVAVTHFHAPAMHHDFPVSPATVARFPESLAALHEVAGWLRAALGLPLPASRLQGR
ncbi:MAG TPA: alpha/beta hydrolase [Acidobacteriaceae bacterium]|nr:alpha/beta hydrolase [Acidobacteriaceae bacterium]